MILFFVELMTWEIDFYPTSTQRALLYHKQCYPYGQKTASLQWPIKYIYDKERDYFIINNTIHTSRQIRHPNPPQEHPKIIEWVSSVGCSTSRSSSLMWSSSIPANWLVRIGGDPGLHFLLWNHICQCYSFTPISLVRAFGGDKLQNSNHNSGV